MPKNGNLDLENFNKSQNEQFLNKEFGSTLCDKLSNMVWEGGRQLQVVAQGK